MGFCHGRISSIGVVCLATLRKRAHRLLWPAAFPRPMRREENPWVYLLSTIRIYFIERGTSRTRIELRRTDAALDTFSDVAFWRTKVANSLLSGGIVFDRSCSKHSPYILENTSPKTRWMRFSHWYRPCILIPLDRFPHSDILTLGRNNTKTDLCTLSTRKLYNLITIITATLGSMPTLIKFFNEKMKLSFVTLYTSQITYCCYLLFYCYVSSSPLLLMLLLMS